MFLRDINKHVVKLVFSIIRISVLFFLRENDVGSFEFYNFLFLFLMFAEYFCTSRKIYCTGIKNYKEISYFFREILIFSFFFCSWKTLDIKAYGLDYFGEFPIILEKLVVIQFWRNFLFKYSMIL